MRLFSQYSTVIIRMNRGIHPLIGLSLLVFCQIGLANGNNTDSVDSPVQIQLELSDTQTHVAEPIELVITITAPTGIDVSLPPLEGSLGPFEVVGHRDINNIPLPDSRRWRREIRLESLTPGELEIPAIEIGYVDRRKESPTAGIASTPPKLVSVISNFESPTKPQQFRDIQSVVFIPETKPASKLLPAAITFAAALLLALGFTAVVFVKRNKQINSRQQILNRLSELHNQLAQASIDQDEALVCLSNIARDFSKIEYQISAPELTTNEFLARASSNPQLTSELKQLLSNLLHQADLIKFAGACGIKTDIEQSLGSLISIVKLANSNSRKAKPIPQHTQQRSSSQSRNGETN